MAKQIKKEDLLDEAEQLRKRLVEIESAIYQDSNVEDFKESISPLNSVHHYRFKYEIEGSIIATSKKSAEQTFDDNIVDLLRDSKLRLNLSPLSDVCDGCLIDDDTYYTMENAIDAYETLVDKKLISAKHRLKLTDKFPKFLQAANAIMKSISK